MGINLSDHRKGGVNDIVRHHQAEEGNDLSPYNLSNFYKHFKSEKLLV